jgi:hypothetical protein
LNREERAILRSEHRSTQTWLDADGERRWLRAKKMTPALARMVGKGWLKFDRDDDGGHVFLVTKCGHVPEMKEK